MAVASKYKQYSVAPPSARVSLRQFALAVHESEGVAAACVSLQDRFALDVNVLLLAAYVGAVRRQSLAADSLGAARALVDPWHADVVRPLRAVRRGLKSGPAPAPSSQTDEVRMQVAKAELGAELIELDVLGDWAAELADSPGTRSETELAVEAMHVALRSYSDALVGDDDHRALATIAAAAARHAEMVS